ncbi:MAG: hypothetical protein ABI640_16450 [Gammaproteobacteria bacterium]
MMNRRLLLRRAAGVAAVLAAPREGFAANYHLVIRGARVIDPSQCIDRRADVAIRDGKIAALGRDIPASAGTDSIDVSGKLVMPGLIDIHLSRPTPFRRT